MISLSAGIGMELVAIGLVLTPGPIMVHLEPVL